MRNPVIYCINTRRSVRKYHKTNISKELVDELLRAAVMAPSARNKQPWNFSIVQDKKIIEELGRRAVARFSLINAGIKIAMKVKVVNSIFYDAPLLIFISGDKTNKWLKDDINLAVQNMFLAAHSMGLGSCYIGLGRSLDKDRKARKILGLPDQNKIIAPLVFGYPIIIDDKPKERKPKILRWIS